MTINKYPQGPHLEMGFYWADDDVQGSYRRLVTQALRQGFTFTGEVSWSYGVSQPPRTPGHWIPEEFSELTLEELQEWLIARDRRVITIRGQVQIGLLPEPAVITYDQITEEAARHDHPSLTIYLGGEEFEEYARQSLEARQKSAWVQSFFRGICHSLHPLLAVITMENWLPCLWEIRHQTSLGALPFTNFFVSHDILTDPLQQALASEFSQGYIADWDIGVYFSSTEEFNPAQKGFRDPWLRGRVAEILRGL